VKQFRDSCQFILICGIISLLLLLSALRFQARHLLQEFYV